MGRGVLLPHVVAHHVGSLLETLLVEEKYLPLARHLLKAPAATAELQFHFKEIEEILNAHLPPEARQFVNWWANQKSGKPAHAFAWMAAGWLIPKVDIKADRVTFKRRGYVLTRFLNSRRLSASSP